jgi:hypothetical protein
MIGVLHEHVDQGRHGGLWPVAEDEKLKVWLMPYVTVSNSVKSMGFWSEQGMAETIPGHIGPSAHDCEASLTLTPYVAYRAPA